MCTLSLSLGAWTAFSGRVGVPQCSVCLHQYHRNVVTVFVAESTLIEDMVEF